MRSSSQNKTREDENRHRVLVVDDDPKIRQTIFHVLNGEFDVTVVESGSRAVEIIRQEKEFDVVCLDLQMPGLSGIETLEKIKEMKPKTEAFIVTAQSDFEAAKEAIRLGAYDFLNKPFVNHEFRKVVRQGIRRRLATFGAEKAMKEAEFVKAQLIQSEKFSEIGKLIAGIAHELKNPLTSITGFSDIPLQTECSLEDMRSYLKKINQGALLCNSIINKLLTFARKRETKLEPLQINSVITSTLELKDHDLKIDGIEVVTQLSHTLPTIVADFFGLQQVFLNLINNAHQAMREHDGKRILAVKSENNENVVRVNFSDTGPGIPAENIETIFEPLFTTKKEGEGTGLGLSICYEIVVKEHGGDIFVTSQPGEGAYFVVEIPVTDQG
jgi:signal transduction histidine kinase